MYFSLEKYKLLEMHKRRGEKTEEIQQPNKKRAIEKYKYLRVFEYGSIKQA